MGTKFDNNGWTCDRGNYDKHKSTEADSQFRMPSFGCFRDMKAVDALRLVFLSHVGVKRAGHFCIGQLLPADAG